MVEEHLGCQNRWDDYIKMGLIGYEAMNWTELP